MDFSTEYLVYAFDEFSIYVQLKHGRVELVLWRLFMSPMPFVICLENCIIYRSCRIKLMKHL